MAAASKHSIKRKVFSLAKQVLPDDTVKKIQKERRERREGATAHYKPRCTYAVVSAIYNVAPYLEDYFKSLTSQTMCLEALQIITVDDGSTDDSAAIIKRWQQRYPELITYVRKENGGQASARNLGLEHAHADWVTFIDPDDFVSKDYFEQVDNLVQTHSLLEMIACNLIFYREKTDEFDNSHPLKYRFDKGTKIYNVQDDYHPIQLSMATVFFRIDSIRRQHLTANEHIKPNFEDADFVNRYLLGLDSGMICFAHQPRYYYRKREEGTSTLDTSWTGSNARLLCVTKEGYLQLLLHAREVKGYIPRYIQNTVLYDLSWYFKRFVGHSEKSRQYIDDGSAETFLQTLDQIFSLIDSSAIENARGGWLRYDWKRALIQRYKGVEVANHVAYIERVSPERKIFLLRTSDPSLRLSLEGEELMPFEEKQTDVPFFGTVFQSLYYRWYRYDDESQVLSFKTEGTSSSKLSIRGRQYSNTLSIKTLINRYTKNWDMYPQSGDTWVFMDRENQADDNGEHFCRWMLANHPEQRVVFALRQTSSDWKRLKAEGFPLVAFGSREHERELKKCTKIVSAHADGCVHSYFGDDFYQSKDFVFLQHGVIKDDLSCWLNNKPITLFVTSTEKERLSIVEDGSPYPFTDSQVILTGLPRHDALLQKAQKGGSTSASAKPVVLVMPTWRNSLTGKRNKETGRKEVNSSFAKSYYAQAWSSFLCSEKLHALMQEYGFEVLFYPHANAQVYLDEGCFTVPSYIRCHHYREGNDIQSAFVNASVFVTDYSSTAFEVAYIGKPCVYYQFDEKEFFSGMQVYAKGYFDYRQDGFGLVVTQEEALLEEIERLARDDFKPAPMYQERIATTFAFHDGKCCERVYDAIKALDDMGKA